MYDLRLPTQAPVVTLQTALTRTLDAAVAYRHATGLSESRLLGKLCQEFASLRATQADRIATMIRAGGDIPDFGYSGEANFQQLWMTLVNRRFPTFREGLPRECERSDRRLERVLARLAAARDGQSRREIEDILRDVRDGLEKLKELREPSGALPGVMH